jgi:hypothetical protein
LGTELGTSKSTKEVRVPSEATPDKRDIVFDFFSHNPKVMAQSPTNYGPDKAGLYYLCRLNLTCGCNATETRDL